MKKLVLKIFACLIVCLIPITKPFFSFAVDSCNTFGISGTVNGSPLGAATISPSEETLTFVIRGDFAVGETYKLGIDRDICANYYIPSTASAGGINFQVNKSQYPGAFYDTGFLGGCPNSIELYLHSETQVICSLGDYHFSGEPAQSCSITIDPPYPDKNTSFKITVSGLTIGQHYSVGLTTGRAIGEDSIIPVFEATSDTISVDHDPTRTDNYSIRVRKEQIFQSTTPICFKSFTVVENNDDPTEPPEGFVSPLTVLKPESCPGGIQTILGCFPTSPQGIIPWILKYAVILGGGIAFLLMLFAGFQIIMSAGDPEKLKNGQQLLGAAISGLLFIIFSVFLLRLIGFTILRIPGFS